RLDATNRNANISGAAAIDAIDRKRHGNGEIAAPPAEFDEAGARPGGQNRQLDGSDHFIVVQSRGHHTLEEIRRGNAPLAAAASRDDLTVERRHGAEPLGGRVRIGDTAAERAARPDRWMRDI